jgi:hypothetical protein
MPLWFNKQRFISTDPKVPFTGEFVPFSIRNDGTGSIFISLSEDGSVSTQDLKAGKPIAGLPPAKIKGTYQHGLVVQNLNDGSLISVSFTMTTNRILPG